MLIIQDVQFLCHSADLSTTVLAEVNEIYTNEGPLSVPKLCIDFFISRLVLCRFYLPNNLRSYGVSVL